MSIGRERAQGTFQVLKNVIHSSRHCLKCVQMWGPRSCTFSMSALTKQSICGPRGRKPNSDIRSLQQRKDLLQGTEQGSGRQASDPLQLDLWVWVGFCVVVVVVVVVVVAVFSFVWLFVCLFVFRRTKRLGLIIFFLIFLNCCFGSLDASGLWFCGPELRGLLAHLTLDKQSEFVH